MIGKQFHSMFINMEFKSYRKLSSGYPVIPMKRAFPASFIFCKAGKVSFMIMSKLGQIPCRESDNTT